MRHFQEELEDLQRNLLEMAGLVEYAVHESVQSLTLRDQERAQRVLVNEARINQKEIYIDEMATRLLARHQPMARDLRFLTVAIKINNDLERMGDLAVNIVERTLSLISKPPVKPLIDMPKLAQLAESMVHNSLDAFVRRDSDLATSVLVSDDTVDDLRDSICRELVSFMEQDPSTIARSLDLILVARNLERIADHATNIAEDVLYMVEGEIQRHNQSTVAPGTAEELLQLGDQGRGD
ncbi:MAG TPA: phosphate signaling complex protein PhoU [Bryobacteraceae bacterium]|nr:phosphate signaling complex protein PhoU [Bryobacteraceae bacterium]